MNQSTRSAVLAFTLTALGSLAQFAVAAPPPEARTMVVNYADVDLTKPEGAHALYRRIQAAARTVCVRGDVRQLSELQTFHGCYTKAVEDAVNKINQPMLTALHRSAKAPLG